MRTALIALCASMAIACTDQAPSGSDGGMDASSQDSAVDTGVDTGGGQDAGPDVCIFDKDKFDNGCIFGP